MTDPLSFLQAAHAHAEEVAAMIEPGGYEAQTWHIAPTRSRNWVQVYSKSRELGEPPEAAEREDDQPVVLVQTGRNEHQHIALHDPAAVLRRIAAERKLLDLHACDEFGDLHKCRECGQGYELADWGPDHPCATVRLLAEAWGWQEEQQ